MRDNLDDQQIRTQFDTFNLTYDGQVKKLADMGGVTEDLSVISNKVRQRFCVPIIIATSLTVG